MNTKKKLRVVLLGRPGCGKGTFVKRVLNNHGFNPKKVPMSSALIALASSDPGIKSVIDSHTASGLLVPNTVVIPAFLEAFRQIQNDPFVIVDGYPRDLEQYYTLRTSLKQNGDECRVIAVHLQTREAICGFRLHARLQEEGRADDNPESIARRMLEYDIRTKPMVDTIDRDASSLGWEFFRLNGNDIFASATMFLRMLHLPDDLKTQADV